MVRSGTPSSDKNSPRAVLMRRISPIWLASETRNMAMGALWVLVEKGVRHAVFSDVAAIHSARVELHREPALAVQRHEAAGALAAELDDVVVDHVLCGGIDVHVLVSHQRGHFIRGGAADEQ